MTTTHDLKALFNALLIYTPTSFSFAGGKPIPVQQAQGVAHAPALAQARPEDALTQALQNALYEYGYARRFDGTPPVPRTEAGARPGDPTFMARLSEANQSRDRWDPGWQVYQLGMNGQIFVKKGERHRAPLPGEYASTGSPGVAVQVGNTVSLRVVHESFQLQPGFYFVFGETLSDVFNDFNMTRLYFHSTSDVAVELIAALSREMNRYQVPFRLKTLVNPHHYDRTDATVLYIARRDFRITVELVAALSQELRGRLRPEVPLFTKQLQPGIGLAEDPGSGESFGMHRCRLVAEGIVDAWKQGLQTPEARLQAVHARFARHQLLLDQPYLNAQSVDHYTWTKPVPVAL